ncbi:TB2/DP1, HVA22 family-domain-containing protein [Myxozyma melibiosi]|uniref:Protein YOP1 n=1 Tax=Myxozyma melibiosi TaxID=54550 RepID=A0ABR1F9G4_9ASCO
MFGIIKLLSSVVSFGYPVYASYKSLRARNQAAVESWAIYWVVMSVVTTTETWFGFMFTWLPLYQFARLGFTVWLVLPGSNGSNYIYYEYIEPTLSAHEQEIETFARSTKDKFTSRGLQAFKAGVQRIEQLVLALLTGSTKVVADDAGAGTGAGAGTIAGAAADRDAADSDEKEVCFCFTDWQSMSLVLDPAGYISYSSE